MTASLPPPPVSALAWTGDAEQGGLLLLDQTLLPAEERRLERRRVAEVVEDIRRLAVRGAPLLGLAGAYGLVLAAREAGAAGGAGFRPRLEALARLLAQARPTAVNLSGAVRASLAAVEGIEEPRACADALLEAARALEARERSASAALAHEGAQALAGARRILTHCNAGALVAPDLGTALAPIYALAHRGADVFVWVSETRPLLQGLRLTAYELGKAGVPHAVVGEGAVFGLMRRGLVDAAIVGADRIAANGDVVNKVGTYGVALGCRAHGLPFYVAAPPSTFDPGTPSGDAVVIEERRGDGAAYLRPGTGGPGSPTVEPAFDVTPADLVTRIFWGGPAPAGLSRAAPPPGSGRPGP